MNSPYYPPPPPAQFAVCLAIIFIMELAVGIAAICFKSDLEMALQDRLESSIKKSDSDDLMAWDNVQRKLQCCGIEGPADWVDKSKNRTLRSSCCRPQHVDPETNDCNLAYPLFKDRYFQEGCVMKLKDKVDNHAKSLIGVGIGIAFIQLLGIFLACWLASAIRKESSD